MSTRTANVAGIRGASGRVSTHEESGLMPHKAEAVSKPITILSKEKTRLLEIIKEKSLLKGQFKLASGATSDYYLDMKPTTFDPEGTNLIASIIFSMLKNERDIDSIGGLEVGAIPIVIMVCQRSWPENPLTGFMVRKHKKGHGTDKKIDANFKDNSTVVLFDDVTTTGGSVLEAVRAVRARGAKVKKIITIVDREEGATENIKKAGIALVAVFKTQDLLG
jgi:orotate phosphoribosyltransferase